MIYQLCQRCEKHRGAAIVRVLSDDPIDYMTGRYETVCDCCLIKGQIAYVEMLAAKLPELRTALETACREE